MPDTATFFGALLASGLAPTGAESAGVGTVLGASASKRALRLLAPSSSQAARLIVFTRYAPAGVTSFRFETYTNLPVPSSRVVTTTRTLSRPSLGTSAGF